MSPPSSSSAVVEGVVAGDRISGLGDAVWADANGDGRVDGFVRFGRYRAGPPPGYDPVRHRVISRATAAMHPDRGPPLPPAPATQTCPDGSLIPATNGCPAPPPPPPPPPHPERCCDPDAGVLHARAYRASAVVEMSRAEPVGLSDVEAWLTNNGTLSSVALGAILEACQERWGGPTPDCEEAVEAGSGRFRVVPADARKEFALLYRDSCPPGGDPQQCLQKIQAARLFRTLPRAQLQPRPLTMDQGVRTHFTANMIDTGTIQGQAGMPTDEGVTHDEGAPGTQKVVTLIPYSARMCFALKAENPKFAKIEPDPQEGVTVENGKLCTNVSEGGSAIKYNPSWWVTPLTGNDLKLYLDLEHYVGNARKVFPYEPHPFVIDVIPKKSWWDRLDAFLARATGTAKLATGLATAIGALITAIAAWQVWGWFKRKKARRSKPSA